MTKKAKTTAAVGAASFSAASAAAAVRRICTLQGYIPDDEI